MSRFREGVQSTAQREALGVTRATLIAADDSKKMQELRVEMMHSEARVEVEHWQPYGFFSVPLPPKDGKEAEVLLAHVGGSRSHAVAIATADRRHRPRNAKPGETGLFDDQGQQVFITRDGVRITGGPQKKPLTIAVGNSSVTIADGLVTITATKIHLVGKTIVDELFIGGEAANIKLMRIDGNPSTPGFST